jgi:hypothetical protein
MGTRERFPQRLNCDNLSDANVVFLRDSQHGSSGRDFYLAAIWKTDLRKRTFLCSISGYSVT